MAVKFLANQAFPPFGTAILVSTRPNTIFDADGKPTGDVDGIRCDCRALPDLSPVSVKVPGAAAPMSNDELERLALAGQLTWVTFDGFVATPWLDRRSGQLRISGTATAVHLAPAPNEENVDFGGR